MRFPFGTQLNSNQLLCKQKYVLRWLQKINSLLISIDEQIKNQTHLSYTAGASKESLPSKYNGLEYKNLIKMEFLLAAFAKKVEKCGTACIPLLFIEEPESHMHPQMQHAFAEYLEAFLGKITSIGIQTFLTSHSAHVANTMVFSKIRYTQKTKDGVTYKTWVHLLRKIPPTSISLENI